jgi:phage terminase large subunit
MNIQVNHNIFNEAFYPHLLDYSHRYEVWHGGAGSGKSHFLVQKILIKALKEPRKILILRKVGKTVKTSVFQLLIEQLTFFKILHYCKINRTDFSITLPNGSMFLCSGLDDPEKLKSIQGLTDAWLEEASEFSLDEFNQIDLRVRHPKVKDQQVYLSFNPISKVNWVYPLFFDEGRADEYKEFRDKVFIHHSTWKDNTFLPQPYIDSLMLLKETNPAYYTIYTEGLFGSLEKLIFQNWSVQDFNVPDVSGELLLGLDFGYTADPTVLICALLNEENRTIYIYEEMYNKGMLNNDIANEIARRGYSKSVIIADAAEPKSIEEIRRLGITRIRAAAKGPGSVLQGIQKLQQYNIVISPSCPETIIEFQNYSWKKDRQTNEYTNIPIDAFNHSIDALRYALQCYEPNRKLSSVDIKLLGL